MERKLTFAVAADLKPYGKNSKDHPESQVAEIAASIIEFGWTRPILVDEKGIVAGHGAVLASLKLYAEGNLLRFPDGTEIPEGKVPVLDVTGWSKAQRRAYIIADNKIAQNAPWNIDLLRGELIDLKADGFNLDLTGFNALEVEMLEEGPDRIEDVPSELPGAQALKAGMVFASDLAYNIPEIRADRLLTWPDNIRTFAGREVTPDDGETMWLWQWRSDSLRGLPRDRHIIGFYVDDWRFDCLFDETAKYVGKILNMGTVACIAPNFTVFDDAPQAVNIYAIYKARYVARYMQEAGIPVIPDANWGNRKTFDYCFLGLPKGGPLAVQLQNATTREAMQRDLDGLKEAVARVEPSALFVYGSNPARKLLEAAKLDVPVTFVLNRATVKAGHIREGQRPDQMKG